MAEGIFLVSNEGTLVEMRQQPYKDELSLQELLEQHPRILAGDLVDSANPRRWLLVTREMGIPGAVGEGNRWSVDHLFLDQDGIPTFVEVKRSTDTRIRREVVGQMLDYAANALAYWPIDHVRNTFESRAGSNAEDELDRHLLSNGTSEEFWKLVRTNFEAGRIRLVFVSDAIPPELKVIIEYLYCHMTPTEVIGVEVPQYVDQASGLRTIVPRLIGPSALAVVKKMSTAEKDSGPDAYWSAVETNVQSPAVREAVKSMIGFWSEPPLSSLTRTSWGKSALLCFPALVKNRALIAVGRNGTLSSFLGYWDETKSKDIGERQMEARDELIRVIESTLRPLSENEKRSYPGFPPELWVPQAEELKRALVTIAEKYCREPM